VRRNITVAAAIGLLGQQVACGGSSPSAGAPPVCVALHVASQDVTLATEDLQTPGFALTTGTRPVGLALDRDGSSVWILGTGSNRVLHVRPDGSATAYQLPASGLGLNLSQSQDGTVWIPEQYSDAVVALAPDGSARECRLPRKGSEPVATSAASDGSVWVSEAHGAAIARFAGLHFVEYPIGVAGAEVLASTDGGAWFTVNGAPILGHITASGDVQRIPIGGSGTTLGLLAAPDGSIWVADFGGDRIVRVSSDGKLTEWKTMAGAKPQSLAVGPAGTIWVTESGTNHLAVVRGAQLDEVYRTGDWPDHMVITADGWAWFTEYYQDRVGRVRLAA
jgi:streptogramin lyase